MIVLKNELVFAADVTAATDDSEVPVTVVATISESAVEGMLDEGHDELPRLVLP